MMRRTVVQISRMLLQPCVFEENNLFQRCSTGAGLWSMTYKWGHVRQFPGVNVEQANAKKSKSLPCRICCREQEHRIQPSSFPLELLSDSFTGTFNIRWSTEAQINIPNN